MKISLEILRLQRSPDLGGITIILSLGISNVYESTWQKMESKVEIEHHKDVSALRVYGIIPRLFNQQMRNW